MYLKIKVLRRVLLTQYLMYDLDPGLEKKLACKLLEGNPLFLRDSTFPWT